MTVSTPDGAVPGPWEDIDTGTDIGLRRQRKPGVLGGGYVYALKLGHTAAISEDRAQVQGIDLQIAINMLLRLRREIDARLAQLGVRMYT